MTRTGWTTRSARALSFVARRLSSEPIAVVFATLPDREHASRPPGFLVSPLGHRDARAMLESVLPAPFDETVLERIVVETRGNPLAVLELPRGLSATELAGGFGLPATVPLSAGIEKSFTKRLSALPEDARRLLLVAAADPVGEPSLVWRAAERLGIPESAADTVESEELLQLRNAGGGPPSAGPLRCLPGRDFQRAARRPPRGGGGTDPELDPDRRAWHRAKAAPKPDEEVAAELEESASRAQARGGFAAAAAFLDRASALTPDESRRSERALAAAQAKLQAGALEDALRLLATAEAGPFPLRSSWPRRRCCAARFRLPRRIVATRQRCCSMPQRGIAT